MQGIHAHAPTIPLPHPGALPPQLPPGVASGLLGVSGQPPHLPIKDEKGETWTHYKYFMCYSCIINIYYLKHF